MLRSNVSHSTEIARWLLTRIQDEPSVCDVWFRQSGDVVELWVVTNPIDLKTEQRLRRNGRLLHATFSDVLIDYQVLNRALVSEAGLQAMIPQDAEHRRIR